MYCSPRSQLSGRRIASMSSWLAEMTDAYSSVALLRGSIALRRRRIGRLTIVPVLTVVTLCFRFQAGRLLVKERGK